jgi:hypothetical protein
MRRAGLSLVIALKNARFGILVLVGVFERFLNLALIKRLV